MENLEKINDIKLVAPTEDFKKELIEAVQEFQAEDKEGHFSISTPGEDFSKFLAYLNDKELGVNLPEGRVPQSELWLMAGNRLIGWVKIRHTLNEELLKKGGHIGYGIRPSERGKGYGTKILELGLHKAKELGIKRILVTCADDNMGSAKIIEKNGGILENKIEYYGHLIRRYWIDN